MDRIRRSLTCSLLAALPVALSPACLAAGLIPIEQFAANPAFSQPAISPDGKKLVFIKWIDGKPIVVMLDLDTQQLKALVSGAAEAFTITRCDFKTNDRLLCRFHGVDHDAGRPYWISRMVALNADGSKMKTLVQNGAAGASQFQDRIVHWLPNS